MFAKSRILFRMQNNLHQEETLAYYSFFQAFLSIFPSPSLLLFKRDDVLKAYQLLDDTLISGIQYSVLLKHLFRLFTPFWSPLGVLRELLQVPSSAVCETKTLHDKLCNTLSLDNSLGHGSAARIYLHHLMNI
jgi:hypothetical protein